MLCGTGSQPGLALQLQTACLQALLWTIARLERTLPATSTSSGKRSNFVEQPKQVVQLKRQRCRRERR